MKSINTYFRTKEELENFVDENALQDNSKLLVQIFSGICVKNEIQKILHTINSLFPLATIIGSTTDGEIIDGKVSENSVVLSFTSFEKTTLNATSVIHSVNCFESGVEIANSLIEDDTKVIISFGDGLNTNGEDFLDGINSVDENIIVSGGLAGDKSTFEGTYVFLNETIISNGAVAVSLSSSVLNVNVQSRFNWDSLGKELIITKVDKNRVYTIDDRTAFETYAHYLGENIAQNLPGIGLEFPLIINRNNKKIARAVMSKKNDGSLVFAGAFKEGDKVQFGYGNAQAILNNIPEMLNGYYKVPSEVIFIYSCMARRHFLGESIETEILPLQNISPVSGFFTYGEFFTSKKQSLLNQTMTTLSLSESKSVPKLKKIVESKKQLSKLNDSLYALSHLVKVTSIENAIKTKEIEKQKEAFEVLFEKSSDGILILENNQFVQCNEKIVKMLGYNSKEVLINLHPSDLSPEFQPDGQKSFEKAEEMMQIALKNGGHNFEWIHTRANGENFWAEIVLTPISLLERDIIHVVWRDISDRKKLELELIKINETLEQRVKAEVNKNKLQEQQMFQQSRLAQMGEMISMIAHQWRQPLGAISTTAANLKLKLELESFDLDTKESKDACSEYFIKRLDNIDEYVGNLTRTIDDFRNFYKSNKSTKSVRLEEVLMKALNIIKASLSSEGIEIAYSCDSTQELEIYDSEFMQVLLNILKNAQDNFKEKNIQKPKLIIEVHDREISITDNGGGIPQEIIEKIFDPYFSTKSEKNGTGLGLYMSKIIVEDHHSGVLEAFNVGDGVCFKIEMGGGKTVCLKQ